MSSVHSVHMRLADQDRSRLAAVARLEEGFPIEVSSARDGAWLVQRIDTARRCRSARAQLTKDSGSRAPCSEAAPRASQPPHGRDSAHPIDGRDGKGGGAADCDEAARRPTHQYERPRFRVAVRFTSGSPAWSRYRPPPGFAPLVPGAPTGCVGVILLLICRSKLFGVVV
jgi:hypothetical protein